jgi:DNA-binding CsgD family transcriptional regulator/tetratricopeptide (TPR) repeat protein
VAQLSSPGHLDPVELHRRTAGNPFYVTEVLAAGTQTVPHSVRDAVLAHASRLPAAARDLLDAASVVPGPAEPWLFDALVPGAAEALDECLGTGVMVLAGDRVEFRHEIARQVVEESLLPGRRKTLHRAALAALAARPAGQQDLAALAHHADAAADAEAVLKYAPAAAAQAAAAGAWREAARLYARALMFADMVAPDMHAALLEGFADAAYATELGKEAADALRQAVTIYAQRGEVVRQGDALRRLGAELGKGGLLAEAAAAISQAVTLLETQPPGRELACAYNAMAAVTGIAEDEGAVLWGKKAIQVAEQAGCLDSIGDTLSLLGTAELRQGDLAGLEKVGRSREIAEQAGDERGMAQADARAAAALAGRREWALAERYIRQGRGFCRDRGLHAWYGWLTAVSAEEALARGRWDEALHTAAELLGSPAAGLWQLRVSALVVTATVGARRGESGYLPPLDEAATIAQANPAGQAGLQIAALRAEAAWLAGAAWQRIGEQALCGENAPTAVRWFGGEPEVWRHRAGLDCGYPAELPEPYRLEITGDVEGAARWWQERGCAYDAALALACSRDRLMMRRALDMLHDLGAQPAAAVVTRQLHALGERGLRRGPRPETAASPAGLTSRQAEVLTLLATGLSNTQIAAELVLSARTVDNHVSAILRKLGAQTRGEATAQAARLGLTGRERLPSPTAGYTRHRARRACRAACCAPGSAMRGAGPRGGRAWRPGDRGEHGETGALQRGLRARGFGLPAASGQRRSSHIATAGRCRRVALDAEFGADRVAVGVADLVEDPQGLCPCPAGGGGVARAAVHVAEAVEGVGLVVAVRAFPVQVEGPLIAGDGLLVVAKLLVDVAKAVPGRGFPVALSQFAGCGQRLFAVGKGLLVVAEQGVRVADVVEHECLPRVVCRAVKVEGPHVVAERGSVVLLETC